MNQSDLEMMRKRLQSRQAEDISAEDLILGAIGLLTLLAILIIA